MDNFRKLFGSALAKRPAIIGMIHVKALPGTPGSSHSVQDLVSIAVREAEIYTSSGLDAVLVENMHDVPYVTPRHAGPEVTSMMTRVCSEVKKAVPQLPVGVQVLAANNMAALAVALAADLDFVRVENFVYGHVADEGYLDACAGPLLRYRKQLGLQDRLLLFTDIKKKHSSHAVTGDVRIGEMATAAQFFCSDGVIVTGHSTGHAPALEHLTEVRSSVTLPILVGSGSSPENAVSLRDAGADGFIVGTSFKVKRRWQEEIDLAQVKNFVSALQ